MMAAGGAASSMVALDETGVASAPGTAASPVSIGDASAFVALMRSYVVDYTNRHDQAATARLMEPDYRLFMGEHEVRGRDKAYAAATLKQLRQFPGLGLTVHEIHTSGERLVMRFSEHGSTKGAAAVWGGIGLYSWNGRRLTMNRVEQDYQSRRRQLKSGLPDPVDAPAIAPWDTIGRAPDPGAEAVVRAWLEVGALARTPGVLMDDATAGHPAQLILDQSGIEIADIFSAGPAVAFHIVQTGALLPDFEEARDHRGRPASLSAAGLVTVADGCVAGGRVIRNRFDLGRRLVRRGDD